MRTNIGRTPQDVTDDANAQLAIKLQKENKQLNEKIDELYDTLTKKAFEYTKCAQELADRVQQLEDFVRELAEGDICWDADTRTRIRNNARQVLSE